ncbi:centrosomal protein of 126 kDa isoform X2 [Girardinichthys multiradiatus]|uniref:centrosomal protein of 126 kDa isoform X2 n=1 Tax=Girardinichthys multiradiatus TaxID=208333 RepID=UPI001FABA3B2|nr:centrosomal protein of 126 kDa isoform X2 [Girardinichthys multiradiatus]
MHALQGHFSYLLNSGLGSDGNLENERQHLAQQQKLSKARARQFLLETNRRRKALDERRKQWDIQEQRLRENILQQRRQQVQDATQRFQRAHLPPSERYRQTARKNATNIEDALSQIQGSLSCYTQNPSVLSTTNTRSCPLSRKPPTGSKSSHHQALSAVEAYAKLLQEQRTIEDGLQDHSPEGSQLSDSCVSESLSSKDSLENEDSNQSTLRSQSSYSSFSLDIENQRKRYDLTPTSDPTSVSAMMLLDQNPAQLGKINECKKEKQEDSKCTNNDVVVSKTFTPEKQTPKIDLTHNPLPLKDCDLLTLLTPINGDSKHFEVKCLINSHNLLVTNEGGTVDTEVEALYPGEKALLDFRSQMVHDGSQINYPSTQYVPFSTENGILFETQLKKSTAKNHLNDIVLFHTEKKNFHLSSEKETCASINNLNKVSNLMYKTEKPINAVSLSHESLSNIQSKSDKFNCPKEEDKRVPLSVASSHSVCDVRFLKGILKKQSTYTSEDSYLYDSGHLVLAKHVALTIRDSIELTRAKTKDKVVNNTIKKKLRWFDEVRPEKEAKEQNTMKQNKDMPYSLSHPTNNSKDHHPSITMESSSSKSGPKMTPADSAGYHFTKGAWTDVGVQVNLPQEQVDGVKVLRTSARTGGPRAPQRNRSVRAGGGPVSSRTRKGTVIRPQSATEVSQIAQTQGKIIVPRPPPRTEPLEENTSCISTTPSGTNHTTFSYKQAFVTAEALCKNNSMEIFSPNKHHPVTADSTVMYTITPHSYPCPACPFLNPNAKGKPSSGHQGTDDINNRGRGMMNKKGLCLHSTPTDEEISQLWHGVRSALNTKDAKPVLTKQTLDSMKVCRKPCTEQSTQPLGSGSRRLLQSSQNTEVIRPGPRTCNTVSPNEGFESAAQLQMAEVHPEGFVKQNQIVAIMERAQPQSHERVQEGLTTLSLEERKIMLSLERLNRQLYCLKEHPGGRDDNKGNLITGTPFTKEAKISNNHKHRGSAIQLHYQKKM